MLSLLYPILNCLFKRNDRNLLGTTMTRSWERVPSITCSPGISYWNLVPGTKIIALCDELRVLLPGAGTYPPALLSTALSKNLYVAFGLAGTYIRNWVTVC